MEGKQRTVVIGTRGSALALRQARQVAENLGVASELQVIRTSGDRFLDVPLQGRSEKGFFTREIEERLLASDIDLAVHSLKDLPTESHPDLCVGAYLARARVSDLLLVHPDYHDSREQIPLRPGSPVGATSLRRRSLLAVFAPQATPQFLRGNITTRLSKCREGDIGAVILARAGIERVAEDLDPLLVYELDPEIWLPAPGQGVIAVQIRAADQNTLSLMSGLNDVRTRQAVRIERGLLSRFEGGCHTAFGAWARPDGGEWKVSLGLDLEGKGWCRTAFSGSLEDCFARGPESLGDFEPVDQGTSESFCRVIYR